MVAGDPVHLFEAAVMMNLEVVFVSLEDLDPSSMLMIEGTDFAAYET